LLLLIPTNANGPYDTILKDPVFVFIGWMNVAIGEIPGHE
jgi:hypothetical protein